MPKSIRIPALVRHKSGNARVRIGQRDYWLGRWGTPEAEERYRRLIAEYLATGRPPAPPSEAPAPLTVAELIAAYRVHCEAYYIGPDGKPTSEVWRVRDTMKLVRELYGMVPASDFGPLRLKTVREQMIAKGWVRSSVNSRIGIVKRCFKWAVGSELIPATTYQALAAVTGLRKGRTAAPDRPPVRPVPEADVNRTLPHLTPVLRDMVRLQLLTGCRSGELVILRPCDVNRDGESWEFTPQRHKTEHHGHARRVFLGPRAQAILAPYLENRPADAFCFSPKESEAQRLADMHAKRVTPLSCGNKPGSNRRKKPQQQPGDQYTPQAYGRAIERACKSAGVPHWSPHRLRHSRATDLRRRFGIETARTVLGHSSLVASEIYAEADHAAAARAMAEVG